MISNQYAPAGVVLAALVALSGCSQPTDPTRAFLERFAEAQVEVINFDSATLTRDGSAYRMSGLWNTLHASEDIESLLEAFHLGDKEGVQSILLSCTLREWEYNTRYYFIPVDKVRPGAAEQLGLLYPAAVAANDRKQPTGDSDDAPPAPRWPPTFGPYLFAMASLPPGDDEQPLSDCLRDLIADASLSAATENAVLERARRMERQGRDRAEDLRLRIGAGGPLTHFIPDTSGAPIVFFSSTRDGWAAVGFTPSDERAMADRNDNALTTCGFPGASELGGVDGLFAPACQMRLGLAYPEMSAADTLAGAEIDRVLTAYGIGVQRIVVRPREGG